MYRPPDPGLWKGRIDPGGSAALRWHQAIDVLDLQGDIPPARGGRSYALLGFCCDEGVRRNLGRTGASEGPAAIRKALRNLCIHSDPTQTALFDSGDVICSGEKLEEAQAMLANKVYLLLESGYRPLLVGGGHEIALGHYRGIHRHLAHQGPPAGIINLDAHFDLREIQDRGNSGTPFLEISNLLKREGKAFNYLVLGIEEAGNTRDLFNRARELNAAWFLRSDVAGGGHGNLFSIVDSFAARVERLYLTVDLDVLNQAYAPGVSAPSPLGWSPHFVMPLLDRIFSTGKVVSVDIAELNPSLDTDSRTARLAAAIVYEIVSMWR